MSATTEYTPFERDIDEQPEALARLAAAPMTNLASVTSRGWQRIVLTGMGSSFYAGLPTQRSLASAGLPVWAVDAARLLDMPGLLTSDTLVIATSQSGASGEIVELLDRRSAGDMQIGHLVGIADPEDSPLATQSDLFLPLLSGPEATVSTKSYLNTLAVHAAIRDAFTTADSDAVQRAIEGTAEQVGSALHEDLPTELAERAATHPRRRLAYIGRGDEAATALFAALITKESSKVPAEGFVGGEFRHGPFELAGDGLTAVFFAQRASDPGDRLRQLAAELLAAGSTVIAVSDAPYAGAMNVDNGADTSLAALALGAVAAERFAVQLARANGVVPGAFLHGSKITTRL